MGGDSVLGVIKALLSFAEDLFKKSGPIMLQHETSGFAWINNASVAHAQSVWSHWLFCRFLKLCSCSYSCFDFRRFQGRLFTNWIQKRSKGNYLKAIIY